MTPMRTMLVMAFVAVAMVSIVAGQQRSGYSVHDQQDDDLLTVRPLVSSKPGSKGPIKKVVKVNRLSKTTSTTVTVSPAPSSPTGGVGSAETKTPSTTPSTLRAVRQNAQPASRRVLRGYPDNQSQASSPKHTYAFNEQDDENFSRRRARFLFRSRVGK